MTDSPLLRAAVERMAADLSTLRQRAEAADWQPMETCPKGEVLLYWPSTHVPRGSSRPGLPEMVRVGRRGDTPNRLPTHWKPIGQFPATALQEPRP